MVRQSGVLSNASDLREMFPAWNGTSNAEGRLGLRSLVRVVVWCCSASPHRFESGNKSLDGTTSTSAISNQHIATPQLPPTTKQPTAMAIRAAMAARSCHINRRRRFTLAAFTSLANICAESGVAYAYNQEATSRRARQRSRSSLSSAPVFSVAAAEIEKLTQHKALWDESEPLSKARRKLKPRHQALFEPDDTPLFNELCATGAMPRKEIFETWSAALYIHETFGDQVRRVCDVAAGHSLLAWALLVLDDSGNNENVDKPLTVLCVDRRMPPSAEVIRLAMIDRWPHLEERFDFVEGSLEQLQPHPSCLLASVHACGGLSDLLIASAASSQSPIALVPCCHTRKKKALLGASDFARAEYGAIIDADEVKDLTTMLDMAREAALRNAGFSLCTQYLDDLL